MNRSLLIATFVVLAIQIRSTLMYTFPQFMKVSKKPFIYNICDSSFKQKFHLNDHIVTVHEENKFFNCNISDSDFTTKPNLKNHIASNS